MPYLHLSFPRQFQFIVSVVLSLLISSYSFSSQDDFEDGWNVAHDHSPANNQPKYRKAIEKFERIANGSGVKAASAQLEIGKCYMRLQEHGNAKEAFERLINKFPMTEESSNGKYLKGIVEYREKNYEGAIVTFGSLTNTSKRKVKSRDQFASPNALAQYMLGECYLKAGKKVKARAAYEDAIKNFPRCSSSRLAERRLLELK